MAKTSGNARSNSRRRPAQQTTVQQSPARQQQDAQCPGARTAEHHRQHQQSGHRQNHHQRPAPRSSQPYQCHQRPEHQRAQVIGLSKVACGPSWESGGSNPGAISPLRRQHLDHGQWHRNKPGQQQAEGKRSRWPFRHRAVSQSVLPPTGRPQRKPAWPNPTDRGSAASLSTRAQAARPEAIIARHAKLGASARNKVPPPATARRCRPSAHTSRPQAPHASS